MVAAEVSLGIASNLATRLLDAVWRCLPGKTIKITLPLPLPGQTLRNPERSSNGRPVYLVRGRLKRLPADHRIWLLTQHEVDGRVWPQGSRPVTYRRDTGEWDGWIVGTEGSRAKIVAVVAPPTSHDFFAYYVTQGRSTGSYGALPRVPPEC
jgi:hypothetical protein